VKKNPGKGTGVSYAKIWLEVIEPVIENPYPLTGVHSIDRKLLCFLQIAFHAISMCGHCAIAENYEKSAKTGL